MRWTHKTRLLGSILDSFPKAKVHGGVSFGFSATLFSKNTPLATFLHITGLITSKKLKSCSFQHFQKGINLVDVFVWKRSRWNFLVCCLWKKKFQKSAISPGRWPFCTRPVAASPPQPPKICCSGSKFRPNLHLSRYAGGIPSVSSETTKTSWIMTYQDEGFGILGGVWSALLVRCPLQKLGLVLQVLGCTQCFRIKKIETWIKFRMYSQKKNMDALWCPPKSSWKTWRSAAKNYGTWENSSRCNSPSPSWRISWKCRGSVVALWSSHGKP